MRFWGLLPYQWSALSTIATFLAVGVALLIPLCQRWRDIKDKREVTRSKLVLIFAELLSILDIWSEGINKKMIVLPPSTSELAREAFHTYSDFSALSRAERRTINSTLRCLFQLYDGEKLGPKDIDLISRQLERSIRAMKPHTNFEPGWLPNLESSSDSNSDH